MPAVSATFNGNFLAFADDARPDETFAKTAIQLYAALEDAFGQKVEKFIRFCRVKILWENTLFLLFIQKI